MKTTKIQHQIFHVETNKELKNALDTWTSVEEAAFGACVPDFILGLADTELSTYMNVFKKAILSELLPPGYNTAICRFFIRVIEYRRDATHYMEAYMANVLCEHMIMEYTKGQTFSYIMAKKVLVWLSILHLRPVVRELRYNIYYEELNAAIIDTLAEVTSLCTSVVIPHTLDLLLQASRVIKDPQDQPSKETLCYAIRRLSNNIQIYMENNEQYHLQLMTIMSNIKANISSWLPDVHVQLQDSTKAALEPFTAPEPSQVELIGMNNIQDHPHKQDPDLPSFPHIELLEKYSEQTLREMSKPEDEEKQRIEISAFVTSLVSGRKITKDFLRFLLNALKNATTKTRMTALIFFSEALKHPKIMKQKDQERAIKHLLHITKEDDDQLCRIAIEGLSNAVIGAQGPVKSCKNKIISHLELKLSNTSSPKVIMVALRALTTIIRCLKLSKIRRFINVCREHMDYPEEQVQIAAIHLLTCLTETCRLPVFGQFTNEVRSIIPTLLLKLNSLNLEMAAASTSSLRRCLSFIKGPSIQRFFHPEESPDFSDRESIYGYLVHNDHKIKKILLLQAQHHLTNAMDKKAVVRHVEFLKDAIKYDVRGPLYLYLLSQAQIDS